MEENEFIAKGGNIDKSKKKKSKAKKRELLTSPLNSLKNRLNTKKLKSTIGILLILLSFYLLIANFSYIFTWKIDQNHVLDKSLFKLLFDGNEEPLANWFGKFGAWSSHLLIYRWFGISSFIIPFIIFIIGFRTLFNVNILPFLKTITASTLYLIWFSLFLGFFSESINFLGGTFGYQLNEWLKLTLGKFGSLVLILTLGYLLLILIFNIGFKKILFFIKNKLSKNNTEKPSKTQQNKDFNNPEEIKENNFEEIDDSEESEEEKKAKDHIEEFDISTTTDNLTFKDSDENISFTSNNENKEPESTPQENQIVDSENDNFSIEVAEESEEDKSLSEDEVDKNRSEYGDYDPTLDLSQYILPPIELLKDYGGNTDTSVTKNELEENKNKIVTTLQNYKIEISKIRATVGPTVTLYEIVPAPGVRISKIKNLEDDIALSLAALGIRIIAPIPGKGTIGIEVPNSKPQMVSMRSLIASKRFQESNAELPIVMGKTITNETFTFDLAKLPHLLVAGATGQGKSVGLNAIIISLLYKKHPSQIKFVLVDPKKVELTLYNRIERHFLAKLPEEEDAIITDTSKVVSTLNSLCIEMDERYELLKNAHCRNIIEYNEKFVARKLNPENKHRFLPYIVVLIDEFADLIMTAGKEIEQPIARIAQLARAIGIHLIVATQRPSVNVITGMIKANFPARIAFRVLSKIDSRTILDTSGADQLIGRGDMLITTGQDIIRLQCGFVDTPEVDEICTFIGEQRGYPEAFILPEYINEEASGKGDIEDDDLDDLFADAARIVIIHQQGSASLLQRKLKLGYNRAGRIVDQLEAHGIIGPFRGSKAREVLYADEIRLEEYLSSKGIL
ncbi:MAG: cell division protein FtsK [Crocinitomicaceae bacterium]|nr:cell division protein FtsK [Crocinitomicaceae bacterium]|tara:strand:- start:60685 stop:63231 length:2547 start_codon:yes stop_codon:yes gene_type:complete